MAITVEQYLSRLTRLRTQVSSDDFGKTVTEKPAIDLLFAIKTRIATYGRNSSEAPIGTYSRKPMYASREQFAKPGAFKARGKNGAGPIFLTSTRSRERKTMYLAGGYKQLREIQSLRTDIMNFEYRGVMLKDFQVGLSGNQYAVGFSTFSESMKRKRLEKKFGAVFTPSSREKEEYGQKISTVIKNKVVGTLKGRNELPG